MKLSIAPTAPKASGEIPMNQLLALNMMKVMTMIEMAEMIALILPEGLAQQARPVELTGLLGLTHWLHCCVQQGRVG